MRYYITLVDWYLLGCAFVVRKSGECIPTGEDVLAQVTKTHVRGYLHREIRPRMK